MYVWGRLHVRGRRIPGRAGRKEKITESYPFFFCFNVFYRVNSRAFFWCDNLVESTLLTGGKSKKEKRKGN
jgi:hypothetical protein